MTKLVLEAFLPYRLNRLGTAVSEQLRAVYRRTHNLTVPEWRVLATLGQYERLTAKAVAAHSAMHKSKVSRAVRALEQRRWLRREENAADRREEFLTLTSHGAQAYGELLPDMLGFEEQLRQALGDEASRRVAQALGELERALGI